ncbi:hypothetical protein [uncultured Algibacter sp.]|uniref:hypothetical protein n=1 Tax=uncultured Algibacter sp. TaxID=298659 RepID=UPI0032179BBD
MFFIEYKISGAGWASGKIGNNEKTITMGVSYLHDSLKELAQSAIDIKNAELKTIVFMDEPGEYILLLKRRNDNIIKYELRWYPDWNSWNLISEDNFKLKLKGETTVTKFTNQVRNILIEILKDLTPEEYEEKWINHKFPMDEYKSLK